jgi:hypothetical protein
LSSFKNQDSYCNEHVLVEEIMWNVVMCSFQTLSMALLLDDNNISKSRRTWFRAFAKYSRWVMSTVTMSSLLKNKIKIKKRMKLLL